MGTISVTDLEDVRKYTKDMYTAENAGWYGVKIGGLRYSDGLPKK